MLGRCNADGAPYDVRVMTEIEAAVPSFEEAYRDYREPLIRLAFLMCGSRELSEDLVQTAFLSAHARWPQIADPKAYLRRTVVNLVKNHQRRAFRGLRLPWTTLAEPVTEIPDVDETWHLIQRLPATQRAVVVLHYYEDLPLVDIAALLDRPASTVRSDLRRALERLRKDLP